MWEKVSLKTYVFDYTYSLQLCIIVDFDNRIKPINNINQALFNTN